MLVYRLSVLGTEHGQGVVTYRLRCQDNSYVTLRSRGYLEFNKQTGQFESFVCINSVVEWVIKLSLWKLLMMKTLVRLVDEHVFYLPFNTHWLDVHFVQKMQYWCVPYNYNLVNWIE